MEPADPFEWLRPVGEPVEVVSNAATDSSNETRLQELLVARISNR